MSRPQWITKPGDLGIITENEFYNLEFQAVDESGKDLSFRLIAGELPPGLLVKESGLIEGIPSLESLDVVRGVPFSVNRDVQFDFVIRCENSFGEISDRSFSITVTGQDAPQIITKNFNLGSYFDGSYVNVPLEFVDLDGETVTWTISEGSLPPGLSLDNNGVIKGYASVIFDENLAGRTGWNSNQWDSSPWDFSNRSLSKTYQFKITITDGKEFDVKPFSMTILSRSTAGVDTTEITADNETIPKTDNDKRRSPVILNEETDLGVILHDNFFSYKVEGLDFDNDPIRYSLFVGDGSGFDQTNMGFDMTPLDQNTYEAPPGLKLDENTGWIHGYIPKIDLVENQYQLGVKVQKSLGDPRLDEIYASDMKLFSFRIVGDIGKFIKWQTAELLGTIGNGEVSHFEIKATNGLVDNIGGQEVPRKLFYRLKNNYESGKYTETTASYPSAVGQNPSSIKIPPGFDSIRIIRNSGTDPDSFRHPKISIEKNFVTWLDKTQLDSYELFQPGDKVTFYNKNYPQDFTITPSNNIIIISGTDDNYKIYVDGTLSPNDDWSKTALSDNISLEYKGNILESKNVRVVVESVEKELAAPDIFTSFDMTITESVGVTPSTRKINFDLVNRWKLLRIQSSGQMFLEDKAFSIGTRLLVPSPDNLPAGWQISIETDVSSPIDQLSSTGRLPQGLKLLSNGLIVGKTSFSAFSIDGGSTTFDRTPNRFTKSSKPTTFDLVYKFNVEVYDEQGDISTQKQFQIILDVKNQTPWDNLYSTALMNSDLRVKMKEYLSSDIFDEQIIYRKQDENFGVSKDFRLLIAAGLNPKNRDAYEKAVSKNHYNKRILLGDIKTAIARDNAGAIRYEVVYLDVRDPLNIDGISVARSLRKNPVNPEYTGPIDLRLNSFTNMISEIQDEVGVISNTALPDWMTSRQEDGRILGYIPAVVLCYTKPGFAKQIAFNLQKNPPLDLDQFDIVLDRYIWDCNQSENYVWNEKRFIRTKETTFDRQANENRTINIVGSVDFAVRAAFSDIHGRSKLELEEKMIFDGIGANFVNKTLVFAIQENFLRSFDQTVIGFDSIGYDNDRLDQNYQAPNSFMPLTIGFDQLGYDFVGMDFQQEIQERSSEIVTNVASEWEKYNDRFDSAPFDAIAFSESEEIPGFSSPLNQRSGIFRITETPSGIIELEFVSTVKVNEAVEVKRGGIQYGGKTLFYDPFIKPQNTVPDFSERPEIVETDQTTFDGNGTRFLNNKDQFAPPDVGDKYIKWPKLGVFQ